MKFEEVKLLGLEKIGKSDSSWIENVKPILFLSFLISIPVGIISSIGAAFGKEWVKVDGKYLIGTEGFIHGLADILIFPFLLATIIGTFFYFEGIFKRILKKIWMFLINKK